MDPAHKFVMAICNQKGGVGKTTTAINLAACLGLCDRRVLVVDLDPQGNATSGLGGARSAGGGTAAFLTGGDPSACVLPTSARNVSVMSGGTGLERAERLLGRTPEGHRVFRDRLSSLPEPYDYVIIDCPPSTGLLTRNALGASTYALIPIQCEYFAMEGLTQMLALVKHEQMNSNNVIDVFGILLTMYDDSLDLNNDVSNEVKSHFPEKICKCIIPRDITLSESNSHGLPIITYNPRSRACLAYVELTREVFNCG